VSIKAEIKIFDEIPTKLTENMSGVYGSIPLTPIFIVLLRLMKGDKNLQFLQFKILIAQFKGSFNSEIL